MAYASPYYDPVKAHEYYMEHRKLKGRQTGNAEDDETNQKIADKISSTQSASNTRVSASKAQITSINNNIKTLQNQIKNMSSDEKKTKAAAIRSQIKDMRAQIKTIRSQISSENQSTSDTVQRLKQQTKGGSTSGFNQKGKEAAEYIKSQMQAELDKQNEEIDKEFSSELDTLSKQLADGTIEKSQINKRLSSVQKRLSAKRKGLRSSYRKKYRDEIDKLRNDDSMFSYWDKRNKKKSSS